MKRFMIINPNDNVMVALESFEVGDVVNNITILEAVSQGHKIAIKDIKKGQAVIKYGYPIGSASTDIKAGSWVHTHNVVTNLNDKVAFEYQPKLAEVKRIEPHRQVMVYARKNGDVGIRNELLVLPTVGCISKQAEKIVKVFLSRHSQLEVDAVYALCHAYGCSQMGDDHVNTRETLQNIAKHPNYGGVLVLGLGCENNQVGEFKKTLGDYDPERIRFLISQEVENDIEAAVAILEELYEIARKDKRTPQDLSKIKIGLKCGGSDGLSGITANPLIGRISDYIVASGGSAVLTEIPEMFGAEQVLLQRSESPEVFNKMVKIINDFKDYYQRHDQVIYENPSPGNKAGGITTLEDKSLGCVQKSGSTNVVDVLEHTETLKKNGLIIISAPGNDLISTTTLGMSGCQLVLFSTGRGTPFGGFIPTIKISTNTSLYERKPHWIDFNSGEINFNNYQTTVDQLIDLVIRVIEGEKTKNEINEFREIAIFKNGVTL